MFGDGFEQSTILRTGPDGLTRVITRSSWSERESVLVEADAAELLVLRRWEEFHERELGIRPPSWKVADARRRRCSSTRLSRGASFSMRTWKAPHSKTRFPCR